MITEGQRVRVVAGSFAGREGTIVHVFPADEHRRHPWSIRARLVRVVLDGDNQPFREFYSPVLAGIP
jgi:transcription antitermination factor NusG